MDNLLQDVRTVAVNAGNGALSDGDRQNLATQLQGQLQNLIAFANSVDGNGGYLFSGFQTATLPFTGTTNGATYNGDQGQRLLQVSGGRQIAISENGSALFERIKAGNGQFVVSSVATNSGTGVLRSTDVADPSQLTTDSYRIVFNVSGGATTYNVIDTTTSTMLSSNNAYTPGGAISFAGMQISLTGAPANGDAFTVAPSAAQSVFTTITNLIQVLRTPTGSPAASAQLANGVYLGLQNIDQALNNMLTVRASLGARMSEVDALRSSNDDRALQFETNLSALQDVDYNKAVSDLARQQVALQAAQQSFAKISQLSLFNDL